jgi:hypothetical protein
MLSNPIRKLGTFIVPMRKAGAIADIKAHPVPHVVGGLGGFAFSAMLGGAIRRGVKGKLGEPAGDVMAFVGNVIGTEVPALIINGIGKATKHAQTGQRIARGWRWGGWIALGINVVATVVKYLTGKKTGDFGEPVLPLFKEGKYIEGVRLGVKEWGLSGLGLDYDHPFKLPGKADKEIAALAAYYGMSEAEVRQLSGMGHQDTAKEYGLSAYEQQLDAQLAALQQERDSEYPEMYGMGQDPRGVGLREANMYGLS